MLVSVFLIFRNNKIHLLNIRRRFIFLFEEREYFIYLYLQILNLPAFENKKYTAWTVW